jgi:hypothetical protein
MAAAEHPPLLRVATFCQLRSCVNAPPLFQLQAGGEFRPMSEHNDQPDEPIQKELDGEDKSANVRDEFERRKKKGSSDGEPWAKLSSGDAGGTTKS